MQRISVAKHHYDSIDFLKGIGIVLVVLGHSSFFFGLEAFNVYHYIYSFHMPLFAFISGIFVSHTDLRLEITKRINRILIPFIICSLMYWSIWLFYFICFKPDYLNVHMVKLLYIFLGTGQNSALGANLTMWFLPYLFFTYITYSILHNKFKSGFVFSITLAFSGFFLGKLNIPLPYSLDTVFTLMPFYWLGTLFLNFKAFYVNGVATKINNVNKSVLILTLFFLHLFLCYSNDFVDTASNIIGNPFLFYASGFLAISYLVLLSEEVKYIHFLNYFGKNSIVLLVFHLPMLLFIQYLLSDYDLVYSNYISFPLTLILAFPLCEIVNRYTPFLVGKVNFFSYRCKPISISDGK